MEHTTRKPGKKVRRMRDKAFRTFISLICLLAIAGGMLPQGLSVPTAYSLESVLVCSIPEHTHSESCYVKSLNCSEENHEHTDECYQSTLICGYQEHTHTGSCYALAEDIAQSASEVDSQAAPLSDNAAEQVMDSPTPTPTAALAVSAIDQYDSSEPTAESTQTTDPTTAPTEVASTESTVAPTQAASTEQTVVPTEASTADPTATSTAAAGEDADQTLPPEVSSEPTASPDTAATAEPQELTLTVSADRLYAVANSDTITFTVNMTGGIEPIDISYSLSLNGEVVYSGEGYTENLSYAPTAYGVHTLTVTAVDASGAKVSANCSIPVAITEREKESDWESTFKDVELSGDFAADIIAIAQTQLGYTESERDFIIDEDGKMQGYTRYGDWYGMDYEEWCAMFVSFCAHYAGIDTKYLPVSANCLRWKNALEELYRDDETEYTPAAGDLIFFHHNRTEDQREETQEEKNVPNHVGIVTAIDDEYIYTIEGNSGKRVRECRYVLDDESIVGYVGMADVQMLSDNDNAFERLTYVGTLPSGFALNDDGLMYSLDDAELDADERLYLVYGRYGDGDTHFYYCDATGTPMGEDMYLVPTSANAAADTSVLTVGASTDKTEYTDADNVVNMTIVFSSTKNDALKKDKQLTLALVGDIENLTVDSVTCESTGVTLTSTVSDKTITLTAGKDVPSKSTVTVKCHYTIPSDATVGTKSVSVTATSVDKQYTSTATVAYTYQLASGVSITGITAPTTTIALGETVSGTVNVQNNDNTANTVTKLVIKDSSGNVVYEQGNSTTIEANDTARLPFSFTVPTDKYGTANYTAEITYGDGSTRTKSFALTMPDEPKLTVSTNAEVSYNTDDSAYFSSLSVTVTDYNDGTTQNNRNTKNYGTLQVRNADGTWTEVSSLSKVDIKDGKFKFDLLSSDLTPDQLLSSYVRVELTKANDQDISTTPYPHSKWFYLADCLTQVGSVSFRDWVLDSANGYVDESGKFKSSTMSDLAEAYKVYARLGLIVTSTPVTGEAGQSVILPIQISSDEVMQSGGTITLELSSADGTIVFDSSCTATSDYGTATVDSNGKVTLTLNQSVDIGSTAIVNLTVPLTYAATLGDNAISILGKYAYAGTVQKQQTGTGTITVTKATGWHIISVESPSRSVMPENNATFTLKIRNFDDTAVELKSITAAIESENLIIVGMRQGETDIDLTNPSITVPANSDVEVQLRVTAPASEMKNALVTFTATDTASHTETAQGTLNVVKSALTIKAVVDYDETTGAVTVKLVGQNLPTTPTAAYSWQCIDTRNPYANWTTIATTGATGELVLTDDNLTALESLGADSKYLQYRLIDSDTNKVYAMSNTAWFENLPALKESVTAVAELAKYYGYTYANFRKLIDNLYYVEVAKDSEVPFSDANTLMLYLNECYKSGGLSSLTAAWQKYRYDLYDPNLWPTRNRSTGEGASKTFRDNVLDDFDFGDLDMNWEKDNKNGQPFHNGTASKVVAAANTESGYFSDLKKTASAVKNGDENTERVYTIDLTAKASGKVMVPAAMVFQIQTSWQMFDLDHANGVNGAKGSPCTVTSMATLYDIKHAMIDFANWLKENSDGSIVFAITDVEHQGTYSAIASPYFTNDSATLINALEGWDIFGNCEHVHYTQQAYNDAMTELANASNFTDWTGITELGETNLYQYAKKIVVVIGGSTENTNGSDGYGAALDMDKSVVDYMYTIRTNSGTGTLSWLDNATMTSQVEQFNGIAFKDKDTRQKVFETLKEIVSDYQKKAVKDAIQDIVLTDTITDEFTYVDGTARVVTEVDGKETETYVDVTITYETDSDGKTVTRLTYKPASVQSGETLHLRFEVKAKEDYIGSNNVYTNEGKATLSYKNTIVNKSASLEFTETPQVNVPIRYEIEDGGEITVAKGTNVDLWTLGETIVKQMTTADKSGINDWAVRYDQINGSVTYQWMRKVTADDGSDTYEAVSDPSTAVHVTNGVADGEGFTKLSYNFSSDVAGDFDFYLMTTFTPDDKSTTWSGVNDGAVSALSMYGKVTVHVGNTTAISVVKVDAQDDTKKLSGAVFTLSRNGSILTFTDLGNGSYALSESGTTELTTAEDGQLHISGLTNGEYMLSESKAPDGYVADTGSATITTSNGEMTTASATNENWTCSTDTLTITLKNKASAEPTPKPTPVTGDNATTVTVRKTWTDDGDKDKKRPESITVQLQANGKSYGDPVTLTKDSADGSGDWVYTWNDLPFKDDTGTVITYTVVEDETATGMQWYDARYGAVEVIKGIEAGIHWLSSSLDTSLDSANYAIYSASTNGLVQKSDDVAKNAITTAIFTGYNVEYDTVYASELSVPAASAQWAFIKVDGGYQIKNSGGYYLTVDKDKKLTYSTDAGSAVWTISDGKFGVTYTKDNKGNTETKYLKIEDKDNGKLSLDNSDKASTFTLYREIAITGRNDAYQQRITNVYKNPNAETSVVVNKLWANNSAYLHVNDSVTVTLYQNGKPMSDADGNAKTLVLNAANSWTGTFTDLPCYKVIDEATAQMEKYVYSVYETSSHDGYTVSGEGEATYVITDQQTGDGHYEVNITNTRDTTGYQPKKPTTSVNKSIDYLGDGTQNTDTTLTGDDKYRLYLDFTGASEPIDVLFVIDTTNSMTNAMGSSDSTARQTVVGNLMNGTDGTIGYLDQVATMNPENNVAVMLFSGPEYGTGVTGSEYPYESKKDECQFVMLNWTSGGESLGTKNYNSRLHGTYYDSAIMRAREMFGDSKVANNGHRKIMIFMTDGEPNGYINDNLYYQYSADSTDVKAHILKAMEDFRSEFPTIETYTIGISSDIDGVKDLLTSMAGSTDRLFTAYSGEQMMQAMEEVMDSLKPHALTITDSLSRYVALDTTQLDLKVTRTNKSTGEVMTVWQGSSVNADGSIGNAIDGYADIIESVQYTSSQSTDSTDTIKVTFNPDLHVDNRFTYTLSYNVKATYAAYQYAEENAEYPDTGDANTDYGTNATSSGQPGLRSNSGAEAEYTASGKSWQDDYPHPVIQTAQKTVSIAAPDITKTVQLNSSQPTSAATFNFTIEAVQPTDAPLPMLDGVVNQEASWTYDPEQETPQTTGTATQFGSVTFDALGTYQYRITETKGTADGWTYDQSEYLWTVTVTRRETDNNLEAIGVLTKDGTVVDKVEFVNEYASDLPLTIVKSDSTDNKKRLSGATFSLYTSADCTAESLYTVYTDETMQNAVTEFTTADDGTITVYGIAPGTYYLKESAAPAGYCLLESALPVSVDGSGITTQGDAARIASIDGKVFIYDSPIYDIPSTGSRGTAGYTLVGLAVMLLAAASYAYRRRERGSE